MCNTHTHTHTQSGGKSQDTGEWAVLLAVKCFFSLERLTDRLSICFSASVRELKKKEKYMFEKDKEEFQV